MRVGAIAFHRDSYQFTQTLVGMKLSHQDLLLSPDDFYKKHGYEKQASLFSGCTLGVDQKSRVALLGRNGTGKSTLSD